MDIVKTRPLYRIAILCALCHASPVFADAALPAGEQEGDQLLWESTSGSWIAARPSSQTLPQSSSRPSLGINYIIALQGTFPSRNSANPAIGQVKIFAGNFAPRGYALCNGQLLSIDDNRDLFSVLGTNYGGDGRTTFALPDLRGRLAVHVDDASQAPGARTGSPEHSHRLLP